MPDTKVNKRNFLIAIASRGISMSEFARSLGVTPQSIDGFFKGKCPSRKITSALEVLIEEEFSRLPSIYHEAVTTGEGQPKHDPC